MEIDKDLRSIQQVRDLLKAAKQAQRILAGFDQDRIDRIVAAVAAAAAANARRLGDMAVEETGFGIRADKELKNRFAATTLYDAIREEKTVGILAGPTPAEVQSGLKAAVDFLESGVGFHSANADDSVVYFAYTVSRTGSYLSKTAGVAEGEALAYLIAPPLESVVGLDEAMKAADVELVALFEPPSETNFGGGLLTGTQSACRAACAAFAAAVKDAAARPREV